MQMPLKNDKRNIIELSEQTFELSDGKARFLCTDNNISLNDNDNLASITNVVYTGTFKHHQGSFKLEESNIDNFIRNFNDSRGRYNC